MTHREFMMSLTLDDLKEICDALGLFGARGYSVAESVNTGLVRLFREVGGKEFTQVQWRMALQTAIKRERWRLFKVAQADERRLRSPGSAMPYGEAFEMEIPGTSESPLGELLIKEAEGLLERVIETMGQIVDEMVSTGRIPLQRQAGCKHVFAAYLDDPKRTLSAYGVELVPQIPRQRLHEYWGRVRKELIRRVGHELLIALGRPKPTTSEGDTVAPRGHSQKAAPLGAD